ncbi:MAG: MlaD family protein, partial [Gammaproteobacteria bacterium]
EVKKHGSISAIWLLPLITLMIGVWLVVKTIHEQGPQVTISFMSAEGIESGKTKIKYKNVDIGLVESIEFAEDLKDVLLTVRFDRKAEEFLKRGTKFWVVRPRISLRGASGLGTLISGSYIAIEPGQGELQKHFVGLEEPPVVTADVAGKEIILRADQLGSIDNGSPVYFRGIQAGEIQGYELGNDRNSVFIHAFIKAPFDELVKGNSRFWNVSGMQVSMDSEGFKMQTESFQSMLLGGIAFVLFLEGSVRGLDIGAPVEFKGIKIGRVVDIRLEFDHNHSSFMIPVLIELEPERIIAKGDNKSPEDTLKTLVDRGLRARLQTGSLLTGKLFVELDMHPNTRVRLVSGQAKIPELPTIPAELEQITDSVKGILAKLEKVELDKMGDELHGALQGANTLLNKPELLESITEMNEALKAFKSVMTKLDPKVEPIAENIDEAMRSGKKALDNINHTLQLFDKLLRSDSPVQFRVIRMADEMAEAGRALQRFLELLEENPQSLIFGKGNE